MIDMFVIELLVVGVVIALAAWRFYVMGIKNGFKSGFDSGILYGTQKTVDVLADDKIIEVIKDGFNSPIILSGTYTIEDHYKDANVHSSEQENKRGSRVDLHV